MLDETFDRIVSVGMFEHVGAKHYDEFFAKCRELLKPDGVMLLHTIGKLGEASNGPDPFTDKWIFPGYHLPSLSQMVEREREGAADRQRHRESAAALCLTLRHWLDRATKARAADRGDVRRALLPHVGILSRRRDRDVRERRGLQLPGPISSATAARCRSRAIIWPRPRRATAESPRSLLAPKKKAAAKRGRSEVPELAK